MCGRYAIYAEEDIIQMREIINEVNKRYSEKPENNQNMTVVKTGEIYPTDNAPVIISNNNIDNQDNIVVPMKWGFPKWDNKGVIFNARGESIREKPMFSKALETRRCILPANGFFEWSHDGAKKAKQKYWLSLKKPEVMFMAGLYGVFLDKDNEKYNAFVILTCPANSCVSEIHDRMPIIIPKDQNNLWLKDLEAAKEIYMDWGRNTDLLKGSVSK